MLVFGIVLTFVYSVIILVHDDEMPSFKMCTHQSKEDFRDIILKAFEDCENNRLPLIVQPRQLLNQKDLLWL